LPSHPLILFRSTFITSVSFKTLYIINNISGNISMKLVLPISKILRGE
jgi:hypothetical protein